MAVEVYVAKTIQMLKVTSKKEVHRIRSKLQTKVVINVVFPTKEEEAGKSLTIVTSNVTIVKNMVILMIKNLQIKRIEKMIQGL